MRFSQDFLSLAFSLLPVVAPAAVAEDYSTLEKIEAIGAQLTRDAAKPGNPVVEVVWNNPTATDQGVKKLFELLDPGRIRVLNLGETGYGAPITDAALVHLKRMDRLEKLYLDNTAITDHGLIHLKKLDRLKELHLNSTGITDDGLRRLRGNSRVQEGDAPRVDHSSVPSPAASRAASRLSPAESIPRPLSYSRDPRLETGAVKTKACRSRRHRGHSGFQGRTMCYSGLPALTVVPGATALQGRQPLS